MVDNPALGHNLFNCVVPTVKAKNGRQNEDE
jgi:queuine/archaeosine tRNA-ribosyltransferase